MQALWGIDALIKRLSKYHSVVLVHALRWRRYIVDVSHGRELKAYNLTSRGCDYVYRLTGHADATSKFRQRVKVIGQDAIKLIGKSGAIARI